MERWKPVLGFEGKYEVSDQGRLKNVQEGAGHVTGRILRVGINLRGYAQYTLGKYGGRHSAHLLVMQAFSGPKPDGLEINHKNGIKTDNRIENLELWSHSHPPGQRVEDKISWAKEFLDLYEYDVIKRIK